MYPVKTDLKITDELPTADDLIELIETLRLARDVKIKRLEDYIQYRERRHYNDECEIAELKDYLAVCIDNLAENK